MLPWQAAGLTSPASPSCPPGSHKNLHADSALAYNKWHENELERWLSDHDIPYPTPADRKDLENLVEENWDDNVVSPYKSWDTAQLSSYLQKKGVDVQDSAKEDKDSLVTQVQGVWYETGDKASDAYSNVKDWILDTWTESQLKAFCDHNGIPGQYSAACPPDDGPCADFLHSPSTPQA